MTWLTLAKANVILVNVAKVNLLSNVTLDTLSWPTLATLVITSSLTPQVSKLDLLIWPSRAFLCYLAPVRHLASD